jgi:hypothetical protein
MTEEKKERKPRVHRCGTCRSCEPNSGLAFARSHCTNPEAIKNWPQQRLDETVPTTMKVRLKDTCQFWATRRERTRFAWLRSRDSAICPKLKVAVRIAPGTRINISPCHSSREGECEFLGSPIFINAKEREVSIKCFFMEDGLHGQKPEI